MKRKKGVKKLTNYIADKKTHNIHNIFSLHIEL